MDGVELPMTVRIHPRGLSSFVTLVCIGCGPGGFASDGGEFGSLGSETVGNEAVGTSSASGPASAGESTGDGDDGGDGDGDPAGSETDATDTSGEPSESESAGDSWTDPETETETDTETETGEPEPAPICARVWTHVDSEPSHGHLGATPLGGREDGGFVTVNPVIGAGNDEVNVDAWFRSWSPEGSLEWERLISWADHRDDPLALLADDLGDLFAAGRTNANTQLEDALVAGLDGQSGDVVWTFLRGEGGGYGSLVHNGAALIAAGQIGSFEAHRLELVAFVPDTGELLWSATPELGMLDVATRGLVMDDGVIDVLVAEAGGSGEVQILRFEPPGEAAELLVSLADGSDLLPSDLERFGADSLAALYSVGDSSFLSIVAREDGELTTTLAFDDLGLADDVVATELVETPTGLAVAGTLWDVDNDRKTFVVQLDGALDVVCVGVLGKLDEPGLFHSLHLRGLALGSDGELITASYVNTTRHSVLARWQ